MLFKNKEQIIKNGKTKELKEIRKEVLEILTAANDSVDSYSAVKSIIGNKKISINKKKFDVTNYNNIYLIGFGKASVGMAQAAYDFLPVKKGAVITNKQNKKSKRSCFTTYFGSHPIPNKKNINATDNLLEIVKNCSKNDLLIVLISGGGSSLFCKPRVNINDIQETTDLLLKSGANIKEINTIRKHLSIVKGGQLAKIAKCTIISLIISDIIDDPIEFIASGPTYPDSTKFIDAQEILKKYKLWLKVPLSIKKTINEGIKGVIAETPKKNDLIFRNVFNYIIANNDIACSKAEEKAEELGYKTMILTTNLDGYAKEKGRYLVEKALNFHTHAKKMIFICGGETTVKIKGNGKGGRNQEMVLSSVDKISEKKIVFSSFATDGIDGSSNAAGAIADTYSLERAKEKKLDVSKFLKENNSYEFFKNLGDALITGPTGTNVMDIQLIIKLT
jgi:glycerate 2-kinase